MRNGMTADPSAIVAISAPSYAPKTRPSTALGVRRCTIVAKLTSTSGLPKPSRMADANTVTGEG